MPGSLMLRLQAERGEVLNDIRVARLEESDLAAFQAIRLESLRMAPTAFANVEADWSSLSDEEWLSRMKNPVFVLFRQQEPVGIMGLMRQRGVKRAHRATLIMVYLRESERRQGLADNLLKAVMDYARSEGVRQLELNVNHHNVAAIRFYERHGFEQVGRIPAALIEDGEIVDELIVVRRLT
jgi:ribosomal protein S18 acetylase RimI-like enzyme